MDTEANGGDIDQKTPAYIVGLGASAGGLEAIEAFFSGMPVDSGMSFVVIQHLAPDFKSLMDELLARHTTMAIHKAENDMQIEPNSIYLIPPKKEMIVKESSLFLRDRNPSSGVLNLPIDIFFQSLAEDRSENAIGIVFSGTGSDGSRGIAAIHEHGGLVLTQSPESAKFDGMPNSAIATGIVDLVINPNEMPDLLVEYIQNSQSFLDINRKNKSGIEHDVYSPIFTRLNEIYDVDFQYYKPPTIGRRIDRRMSLTRQHTIDDYIEMLDNDNEEVELLYRDLLIGVTQFFRDDKIWRYLEHDVLPEICQACSNERELRFWIPGCATGEEAYSLAILIHEYLTEHTLPVNVRVFATDLHKDSLAVAGKGVYPSGALMNLSHERKTRYFTDVGHESFEVIPEIRRMVVFAHHNVLKDPPFTKIDFISCRNLLIYFIPNAQKRVLSLFHFALNVQGVLFLGPSESLGDISHEFDELHRRNKLYRKRRDIKLGTNLRNIPSSIPITSGNVTLKEQGMRHGSIGGRDINLIRAYDNLLDQYVPPSLLVELNGTLAHTFGEASDYLKTPAGVSSLNVLNIIHPDLRMAVSTGLQRILKSNTTVSYGGIKVTLNETDTRVIRVSLKPMSEQKPSDYVLVVFEEARKIIESNKTATANIESVTNNVAVIDANSQTLSDDHVKQLEEELRYTKENLQATVEELETSNEELQATNEELMASNEELQSTNEELHSVNEELYTVNREYEEKIQELTELTDDMDNLLACTDIGTIFLDKNLKIRKFTPAAARQFSLIAQDIGRPISHLNRNIEFDDFLTELDNVKNSGVSSVFEVRNLDNRWYLMGLHPYRNENNETTGIVVTFVEITLLKEVSQQISQRNEDLQSFAYSISHDLNEPVRILTGFSELLVKETGPHDDNDENIQPILTQIKDASFRLKEMLAGTLNFSRIMTQGGGFLETSLLDCLEEAKNQLKQEIQESNMFVVCENLPVIQCDNKQITRVFYELLSNSIKFRNNSLTPEVNITYENTNDKQLIIHYRDNGVGIADASLERIFHIFYTGHHRNEYSGLGLGMALAKRIVERHEGIIQCVSGNDGIQIDIKLPYLQ